MLNVMSFKNNIVLFLIYIINHANSLKPLQGTLETKNNNTFSIYAANAQ